MKLPRFKKWGKYRWAVAIQCIVVIVCAFNGAFLLAIPLFLVAVIFLYIDFLHGELEWYKNHCNNIMKDWAESNKEWNSLCGDINNTWRQYANKVTEQRDTLKEQYERLKAIQHIRINNEEDYNYE